MNRESTINNRGPEKGMRTGYTTGACAAAAARAAARYVICQRAPEDVVIRIPNGSSVKFIIVEAELISETCAMATVIKDGGDDPDCTHGAEIIAKVELINNDEAIEIFGGVGVAKVTKPGLGLEVGTSAINPVPRSNISEMLREELQSTSFAGAKVEISVPDGQERAKKTINERLGLIGGISILGTTGVVLPYSTSAFIASVVQSISLAAHTGEREVVFTTGGRSEQSAMKIRPELNQAAFIQVGDYIGIAIRNTVRQKLWGIHIVAMMGKLSKIADGRMMTHASASEVNMLMLANLAASCGASPEVVSEIEKANTARHVLEICEQNKILTLPQKICEVVASRCVTFAKVAINCRITMVSFSGDIIGEFNLPSKKPE